MKKIAVLVHGLSVEYASTVVSGIVDYFDGKPDVALLITQTRHPQYPDGLYEYQYWTGVDYLAADDIDAVIIVTTSYTYMSSTEQIKEMFSPLKNKLIVSVGMDIGIEGSYYTAVETDSVYDEIIKDLKEVQGCKKIAFVSGTKTGSPEAWARYNSFLKAMEKYGLEFEQKNFLDGNFTYNASLTLVSERCPSKEYVDFDAIVCANDLMAVGAMEVLQKIGVNIPKDVKIIGFDNTSHATMCFPPLTTVDQQIAVQGYKAAEVAYRLLHKEELPKRNETPLKLVFRESTGGHEKEAAIATRNLANALNYYNDIARIDVFTDLIHNNIGMEDFIKYFWAWRDPTGFEAFYCCLLNHPVPTMRQDKFSVPDKVHIAVNINLSEELCKYYEKGRIINPQHCLFPDSYYKPGVYMFQPLYHGELQYGYLLCQTERLNFATNGINIKMITRALVENLEYTKTLAKQKHLEMTNDELLKNNTSLIEIAKTDELTQILNRRGFMEYSQRLVDITTEMGNSGLVFFADLDGLKQINDKYGHDYGDLAIRTQAIVLQKAFRKSDVVGRLSGDEFAIVAPGLKLDSVESIREKVAELDQEFSLSKELPFIVSISLGAIEFTPENKNIAELLKEADKKLYVQKKIKHGER